MIKTHYAKLALSAFAVSILASCANLGMTGVADGNNSEQTYLGQINYQDQTITKASAKKLNREIDLQRASQLTLWAMPMVGMYQSYNSTIALFDLQEGDAPIIGLHEGYDGVYPFLTANVTTPYTISLVDLSETGPYVVNIPAGSIFGVANNAWQEPIKEIGSGNKETLLFVGPGQEYPKDFDGEVIQSDTNQILYFYRVLGVGAEAEKLKTAVTAYKLSDVANPPQVKFVIYKPKASDADVTIATQPRGMAYWEVVNQYIQNEPMADRDRFFYAWLKDLGIEKGKAFNPTPYQKEILLEGVNTGMAMAQSLAFNKTKKKFSSSLYGSDSGWEGVLAGMDPKIDLDTYSTVSYTHLTLPTIYSV